MWLFYRGLTSLLGAVRAHLQHTHAVGVSQNLVCLRVVAVADVSGCNKEFKGVILLQVESPTPQLFLQLTHPLLSMAV